jgi:hypothetical protein
LAEFEYELSDDLSLWAATSPRARSAVDWVTEHQDAAVERLFLLLEQNQAAIAALAQAWRHTRRALEVTQDELARTLEALAAETAHRHHAAPVIGTAGFEPATFGPPDRTREPTRSAGSRQTAWLSDTTNGCSAPERHQATPKPD